MKPYSSPQQTVHTILHLFQFNWQMETTGKNTLVMASEIKSFCVFYHIIFVLPIFSQIKYMMGKKIKIAFASVLK